MRLAPAALPLIASFALASAGCLSFEPEPLSFSEIEARDADRASKEAEAEERADAKARAQAQAKAEARARARADAEAKARMEQAARELLDLFEVRVDLLGREPGRQTAEEDVLAPGELAVETDAE